MTKEVGSTWLPLGFQHPRRVELPTGHHLRPIRGSDVDIDYPAVMSSRATLWARYGAAWGWPPPTMTPAEDRADLDRHEREIAAHQSFNYAVLDVDETRLLGCVYIDPPEPDAPPDGVAHDAQVSWWVVDAEVDADLDRCLREFVPHWLGTSWPFTSPLFGP